MILAACGTTKKTALSPEQVRQIWLEQQQLLARINGWQLRARAAIRTADDSGTISIYWQQQHSDYNLKMIAPFGRGSMLLEQKEHKVSLQDAKGEILSGKSAAGLIWMRTGWEVPVDELKSWVLGKAVDTDNPSIVVNSDGSIQSMRHQKWQINYLAYKKVSFKGETLLLPSYIVLKSAHLQLKMRIHSWRELH